MRYRQRLEKFRKKCRKLKNICLLDTENKCYAYDICKLVFIIEENGKNADRYTGTWLAERLAEEHRIIEMAGEDYVIAMTSVVDKEPAYEALYDALEKIDAEIEAEEITTPKLNKPEASVLINAKHGNIPLPELALPPGEAMNLPTAETELAKAANMISAETIYAYPPGIPLLVSGEKISENTIKAITQMKNNGLNVQGIYENNNTLYIKIIREVIA